MTYSGGSYNHNPYNQGEIMKLKNIKTGFILIGMIFFLISCGNEDALLELTKRDQEQARLLKLYWSELVETRTKTSCLERLAQVRETVSKLQKSTPEIKGMISDESKYDEMRVLLDKKKRQTDEMALDFNRDDICIDTGYNSNF